MNTIHCESCDNVTKTGGVEWYQMTILGGWVTIDVPDSSGPFLYIPDEDNPPTLPELSVKRIYWCPWCVRKGLSPDYARPARR